MLTDLQKARIAYHLDFVEPESLLEISQDLAVTTMSPEKELAAVGPASPADPLTFEGQPLCSKTSALGLVELAHAKLSPEVIDDSLLVRQAGKVSLRSDELKARERLYSRLVDSLAQLVGYTSQAGRVGF